MTIKNRVKKLEKSAGINNEDIIDVIEISFINPDGTTDSKMITKLIDGKWTKLCQTNLD